MRKAIVNLSLALIALLVALGAAEFLLRVFLPVHLTGDVNWYQYDGELGVRLRDGIHSFRTTDHQQEIKSNKIGTVNFQQSFSGYGKLVFAIGDSYTQGTGLPSDASYPAQLDLKLNLVDGKYDKRYGVVNLGLSAYGLEQEILALERYRKLIGTPNYILFLGCDNDFEDDNMFLTGYRHRHLVQGNPKYGPFLGVLQWVGDLEIGKRAKLLIASLSPATPPANAAANAASRPSVAQLEEARLKRLVDLARSMNARLVVSWANVDEKSGGGSYGWLKEWSRIHNVQFADWYPAVASVAAATDMPLWNRHSGGHYRVWVNAVIADTMAGAIQIP
jgi:lysophospholipase L1-like esterase